MSLKIGLILSSVRENRAGVQVADWLLNEMNLLKSDDVVVELIDLKDYKMPFVGIDSTDLEKEAVKLWQSKMSEMDGYVLLTPEYNRMVPGSLANAFQFLFPEVSDKPLAFVGYGFLGGSRAINNFRAALSILKLALVQKEVNINGNTDFKNLNTNEVEFTPGSWLSNDIKIMMGQLTVWARAFKDVRAGKYSK